MDNKTSLERLAYQWNHYLTQRGHQVWEVKGPNILISRDKNGQYYRWLLLTAEERWRRLTAIEHQTIQKHLVMTRNKKDRVYVVIEFQRPAGKVIVMSAAKALEMGKITSDIGGINLKL